MVISQVINKNNKIMKKTKIIMKILKFLMMKYKKKNLSQIK